MMSKDLIFSHWVDDVKMVVNELTEGPIVLVGASTGGIFILQKSRLQSSRTFCVNHCFSGIM